MLLPVPVDRLIPPKNGTGALTLELAGSRSAAS